MPLMVAQTWYDLSLIFAPPLCHLAHEQAATMAVRNANRSLEVVSRGLPRFRPEFISNHVPGDWLYGYGNEL
jgi:hypothetical protein